VNKPIKEIRFSDAQELRIQTDAAGKRTLTGYAAVFNEESQDLGGWTETIKPGAFRRSLATGPDVMALSEHDRNKGLLGRTKSGTLRLSEDNVGLRFECDIPDTQLGNDTAVSVARRDLDACSFGFIALDTSWDQNAAGGVVRTLNDVDLRDVTITSQPAYLGTSVQLRSMAETRSADQTKTKEVDGEHLTAADFLIVGSEDDPSTWKLPVHFSSDAVSASHVRDALSRFDQLKDVSADDKKKAWTRLMALAKQYDIKVADTSERALTNPEADDDSCSCACPQCQGGDCNLCSSDDCADPNCGDCEEERTNALLAALIERRLRAA
jgi:HK97 family phage prohead protease